MAEGGFLAPVELAKSFIDAGEKKAKLPIGKMLLLGILAGVYIGFGAHLATTVATGPCEWYGVKRLLVGASFTVGLMLVVIPGAELFTGNNLMTVALFSGRIGFGGLLRNWVVVYVGNLVGSVLLALIIAKYSGLLTESNGALGATAISIAQGKTCVEPVAHLDHNVAFFFRGIACNWLVCLAVMMAVASKDITGKIFGIFFPIMAFVAAGFEHSVANMYFIPAGIFAKDFPTAVDAFLKMPGKTPEQLACLNWTHMWTQNLIAVTVGNIVGGAIFVGVIYFFAHVRGTEAPPAKA
jgi:formate/nitrite transporter